MASTELSRLQARFGIAGQLQFGHGPGGLAVVEVENAHASAQVALQGAQVLSWAPRGAAPVLWLAPPASLAPGRPIRGGVPICWPWFGAHASGADYPSHGFARSERWEPVETRALEDGTTWVHLRLPRGETSARWWPHPCALELGITIGAALELELITRNTGALPFTLEEALHSYFAVSDVGRVAVQGLAGGTYLDKLDGIRRRQPLGPLTLIGETDRVYFGTNAECLLEDPGLRRRIRISKRGGRTTVVWNPWAEKAARMPDLGADGYLRMLCVESANVADDRVTLAPGTEHRLWVRYRVEPLD